MRGGEGGNGRNRDEREVVIWGTGVEEGGGDGVDGGVGVGGLGGGEGKEKSGTGWMGAWG